MLLLLAFCSFLFFHHLGDRDLWASHEGRAAENAQMMLSYGHWLLPRQCDFRPEMQKPPLYYWLVAGIAWLRGGTVDATAVRLPAALAALGMVCALYWFGLRRGRPLAGLLAALMLASMAHFTWLARVGRIDMPLAFMVTVTLIGFYEAHEGGGWPWSLLAYVAVAAGLLLKGPIAVILPGGVIGAFLLVEKRWPRFRSLLWGVPLVLLIAVPWYAWIGLRMGGGWYRSFFWYHNIERALGSGALRSHPWWFYVPRLGMDLLPWSLLLPAAGVWACLNRKRDDDAEARFGLVWLLVIAVILSAVGFKRADYLVPAYPGAALFLGCVADRWLQGRRLVPWAAAVMAGLLIAYAGGWWVYEDRILAAEEPARELRTFAAEIRARAPQPKIVVFFRVEAHALAFHLGPPVNTVLEWENIDAWLEKAESHLVVTSPECAAECVRRLPGRIERVFDNGAHELRLVVLRTIPVSGGS